MKTTITITINHDGMTGEQSAAVKLLSSRQLATPQAVAQMTLTKMLAKSNTSIEVVHAAGWVAGWNVPGYLPVDTPQIFDDYVDACAYLIDELERGKEQEDLSSFVAMYDGAVSAVASRCAAEPTAFWYTVGDHVWWVAREQ